MIVDSLTCSSSSTSFLFFFFFFFFIPGESVGSSNILLLRVFSLPSVHVIYGEWLDASLGAGTIIQSIKHIESINDRDDDDRHPMHTR